MVYYLLLQEVLAEDNKMTMQIIGNVDPNKLFCSGSFSKLLTTFVTLSILAEKYSLADMLDDELFLDQLATNESAKSFLRIFQQHLGSRFTIRDICTYYAGLPYTFDVSPDELAEVEAGQPFKHHSILDEKTFLKRCRDAITPIYPVRSKFHYSEVAIIFLGYFIEQAYGIKIETLYQRYVLDKFQLHHSIFSRKRTETLSCQDLSDQYDYPSIAIVDHGYFCYSNGFFTTLNDMKILLEHILQEPIFHQMVNLDNARAASGRLLNGLTIEIRLVGDDVIYGYEGLSFSGCNCWVYSTKKKQGYLTFSNSEEEVYKVLYDQQLGYHQFDKVPEHTEQIYQEFLSHYDFSQVSEKHFPPEFQGNYQRVTINEKILTDVFQVGSDFIVIRNPEEVNYPVVSLRDVYRIKGKDNIPGIKVGLLTAQSGNRYMYFDGTLYKLMV